MLKNIFIFRTWTPNNTLVFTRYSFFFQFVLGEPILQMVILEKVLRSALTSEDYIEKSEIVTPKSNTQVYWLYNELANLLTKQKSLKEVLSTFRNGQDAIWSPQDPLPFIGNTYSYYSHYVIWVSLGWLHNYLKD